MTIEQVIKKAIEAGYALQQNKRTVLYSLNGDIAVPHVREMKTRQVYDQAEIFLDPAFWQSLGNAMGWDKDKKGKPIWIGRRYYLGHPERDLQMKGSTPIEFWQYQWLRFIDHLADEKGADEFFEHLS